MSVIELKGKTASPYSAKGVARIINSERDLELTTEKDILVLVNSTPLMVPYLVKSRGFVAEIGGLLTHICIVAREFEKPCIIYVKNAKELIKTGEEVELDAERGIVRIFRRD